MKKIVLTSLLFCFALPMLVFAQVKIAVIDMQKVFNGYDKTKLVTQKMNEQVAVYKDHAGKLQQELQKLQKEGETLRNEAQNVLLTDAERENRKLKFAEKVQEYRQKSYELAEYNKTRDDELKKNYEQKKNEIVSEIKLLVQNKCVLEGYTLVLDKSGSSLNELPVVIYSSSSMDITDSILNELNRMYRTGKKKSGK